jgi:hypothetical protein
VHTQLRPDKIYYESAGDEDRHRRARQIRDVSADRRRRDPQSAEKQLPWEHGEQENCHRTQQPEGVFGDGNVQEHELDDPRGRDHGP